MSDDGLPLAEGDEGPAIVDLQRRLRTSGATNIVPSGRFDTATTDAVRAFQQGRGLTVDGVVGPATWTALIEASRTLGDRLLYLRTPMLRGDDVESLQRRLGSIGFDAGRVDGIFGPDTERAVQDFQRNVNVSSDGIAGPDTLAALARLGTDRTESDPVAQVRELDRLSHTSRQLTELRIVVGETGGANALVQATARTLRDAGAKVMTAEDPEWSTQAKQANSFGAEIFIALELGTNDECDVSYFATTGFHSVGGASLATLCAVNLGHALETGCSTEGRRLPILRETRMPAVYCRLGPADRVVARLPSVADALRASLEAWASAPLPR